ncbi:MAG: hypothetical protein PHS46_07840 [Candidatus Omnitrophica bacterium]|nr:hypothetical protein [Candidatus Omnitrophota bacterium]
MNDFETVAMRRHEMLLATHPIHSKRDLPPRMTERIIPVHEKIAQLQEAVDCYQMRIDQLNAELAIYRDEE